MNKLHITSACLIAGGLFISTNLSAMDLGKGLANESDSILLKNQNNNYTRWNGIGKIFINDTPQCTASLLDTRGPYNNADGPAYLLTNAHCVPGASTPVPASPYKHTIKFNYFNDTLNASKEYEIKETSWKNYHSADIAIMELAAPLSSLLDDGITPLKLAPPRSRSAGDILVVGAPEFLPDAGVRMAACAQEPVEADLLEGGRTSSATFKNRCKDIRGGSSGSPVLDRSNGEVLSVLSTSTLGATVDEQCFSEAPCEVSNGQPAWSPDTHYSHPVDHLASCFNTGIFNPAAGACAPEPKSQVTDIAYLPGSYLFLSTKENSSPPVMSAEFSLNTPYYRYKTVRQARQCKEPQKYSDIFSATDASLEAPLSKEQGIHYLCIIGVDSAEQELTTELLTSVWDSPAVVMNRKPVPLPEYNITLDSASNQTINWTFLLPTRFYTLYYTGPVNTDCSSIKHDQYTRTFEPSTFNAEQLPLMLCARNVNFGNYASKVRSELLDHL